MDCKRRKRLLLVAHSVDIYRVYPHSTVNMREGKSDLHKGKIAETLNCRTFAVALVGFCKHRQFLILRCLCTLMYSHSVSDVGRDCPETLHFSLMYRQSDMARPCFLLKVDPASTNLGRTSLSAFGQWVSCKG